MATETGKEEQARRAQALAEKCFLAGNLFGARQWMQSAARLAPGLPGTAQIVAAYDVHAAAARRPPDWYAVLGLPPPGGAGPPLTHDDVKRQHRRLCLLVHPDKNPCAAADGAFKLVQAAWEALSARHPPGGAAAAVVANKPWPPPPTQPQPAQRQAAQQRAPPPPPPRRPQVVQMPRRASAAPAAPTHTAPGPAPSRASSNAQQASTAANKRPQKKGGWVKVSTPSAPQRPTSPVAGKCPSCGARTNGKKTFRCMSCQWSPMDERQGHDDDYDDDFFDYDY
ncbi:hypothetical protein U9M48_009777 [Paspalum notatum var. saurae]|uniref:J domain-containing protein n=1 Tax=Paspalum notatum var. saurae TaxID=547442 RepID=A0AAQ3WFG4_PASNO